MFCSFTVPQLPPCDKLMLLEGYCGVLKSAVSFTFINDFSMITWIQNASSYYLSDSLMCFCPAWLTSFLHFLFAIAKRTTMPKVSHMATGHAVVYFHWWPHSVRYNVILSQSVLKPKGLPGWNQHLNPIFLQTALPLLWPMLMFQLQVNGAAQSVHQTSMRTFKLCKSLLFNRKTLTLNFPLRLALGTLWLKHGVVYEVQKGRAMGHLSIL